MAKPWAEVLANPDYQALSEGDKARAKVAYFNEVVRPQLKPEELPDARRDFFSYANNLDTPSMKASDVARGVGALASGAVSWIPEGVIKAAGAVTGQTKEATDLADYVKQKMTPDLTPNAESIVKPVSDIFEGISNKSKQAADWTYENTDFLPDAVRAALATGVRTAGEAVPFVAPVGLVKGIKGIKKAASLKGLETGIGEQPVAKPLASPVASPEFLETAVKGGNISELPKYAEGSSLNLERMDTTNDVKQFQNVLTKAAEKETGKRKISWDETVESAQDLAWDEKAFLKEAKSKGGFDAAEIHAMRQINSNALHDLFNTIKDIPAEVGKRTDDMRMGVIDKVNNYVEIMKAVSAKSSEAGRALNIHKKLISEDPAFAQDAYRQQVFKKMMDNLGGKEMTDAMISDLQSIDFSNPKAVRDIIQKYHKSGITDMIYEAWLNGLLSAPATHAANILGNTLTMMTKIPETVVASTLKGKLPAGEVKAEFVGAWQGAKEGIRAALKSFQDGLPTDTMTKIENQRYTAIPGKVGEVIRVPTRALTAADEFFKSIVYRSELNRQAYNKAIGEGLKGDGLAQRMTEIMSDPAANKGIFNKAHEEALYRTFNNPLGEYGNIVMNLRDKVPALRYFVPFIRTPANIAKFALERTPLDFLKIALDVKHGKIPEGALTQELAKPIVGSLISAATVMAALEGNITGAPPKDKTDRNLKYASGWQPYSIKIGDKYYGYNRLEPIGSIIGMTADFVETATDDDKELNEKAGNILTSFSRNIASKTFLQGISGLLDAISDPERYGGNFVEKLSGSVIPSFLASSARAVDPYIRDTTSPLEAIQARIPIASKNLPPKLGAFDLPIERTGSPLTRFLSPMSVSEENTDIKPLVEAELMDRKIKRLANKDASKLTKEALRALLAERYNQ